MLDEVCNNVVWLEFTGGEPFLRKETTEIVSYAINKTGIVAAGITSNGLDTQLVVKNVCRILEKSKEKQFVVGISLDGNSEMYERIRGVDGFGQATKTYLELKQLSTTFNNLRPHIAYTINRFNAGAFQDFYFSVLKELDIDISDVSITIEHPFGYYFEKQQAPFEADSVDFKKRALRDLEFIQRIRQYPLLSLLNPVELFYRFYLKSIPAYFRKPTQQIIPCKACASSVYIDPFGSIFPCTMWTREIGNIRETSFSSIWASPTRRKVRQMVSEGKCPNCWTPCEAQPSWLQNFGFLRGWW